jgi:hypothetical protein
MASGSVHPNLKTAADEVAAGKLPIRVTTREFLSWFNAQRRGYWIVHDIRRQLEESGLETVPDFEANYIDSPLELRSAKSGAVQAPQNRRIDQVEGSTNEILPSNTPNWVSKDPTYRISKLGPATQGIVSVAPNATLAEAITVLLSRDFSQLPVMAGTREVKGIINWRSIGSKIALSKTGDAAKDFMEPHQEIRSHFSIFDAIPIIVKNEYVLIRGDDQQITGIITATDLSEQFQLLSEPFLLLGEIENILRSMIADRFSNSDLIEVRDPNDPTRQINSPSDLAFGEYVKLLENADRWKKFGIGIDRVKFREHLEQVRLIRNDVMHFDPDGVPASELKRLRDFANFLKRIQSIILSNAETDRGANSQS